MRKLLKTTVAVAVILATWPAHANNFGGFGNEPTNADIMDQLQTMQMEQEDAAITRDLERRAPSGRYYVPPRDTRRDCLFHAVLGIPCINE
jgi:hypothetical protein